MSDLTFKQFFGKSINELLESLFSIGVVLRDPLKSNEGWTYTHMANPKLFLNFKNLIFATYQLFL